MNQEEKEKALQQLSALEYQVTQNEMTEAPYSGRYDDFFEEGLYVDIVSGEVLFSSQDKFASDCGWPSFTKALTEIQEIEDNSFGMQRIEVRSKEADSHLGHVFEDGPREKGGRRYCINSSALRFISKDEIKKQGYEAYLNLFQKED